MDTINVSLTVIPAVTKGISPYEWTFKKTMSVAEAALLAAVQDYILQNKKVSDQSLILERASHSRNVLTVGGDSMTLFLIMRTQLQSGDMSECKSLISDIMTADGWIS